MTEGWAMNGSPLLPQPHAAADRCETSPLACGLPEDRLLDPTELESLVLDHAGSAYRKYSSRP